MKNNDELLFKITHHKKLLFWIPNLICFYQLFYYYNQNFSIIGAVLFYEVILGCLFFLIFNSLLYFFLQKALKDEQKTFCVMCLGALFYFVKMNLIWFLIFVVVFLLFVYLFKRFIQFSLDGLVFLASFITIILFSFAFLIGIYDVIYLNLKSKSYNYTVNLEVDKDTASPNIYWIHCDGMMSQDTVLKYYQKNVTILENYFKNNNYLYNSDASFAGGHATQKALLALFNPEYYDSFFKDYLLDLEEVYLNKKTRTDFIVNYYELEEKRLNNELFQAFKKKGYETVAIADFSAYTSFYVDHFYDFYRFSDDGMGFHTDNEELRYINGESNSKKKLKSYIRFNHSRLLADNTLFYSAIENINYLDYETVDYLNMDLSDYPNTEKTKYWISKATFKGIEQAYSDDVAQFTFIDYKIAHFPLFFNSFGELLEEENEYNFQYYLGNYIYACNLLVEMLDYIQSFDENAVIVVQGDHGIHVFKDEEMMAMFDINETQLQEIRNSVISAVYIPEQYQTGEEFVLENPLNISRYLINSYVGKNYSYLQSDS